MMSNESPRASGSALQERSRRHACAEEVERPPGYRRMKHDITMDSGSNVDIVPPSGDPAFEIWQPTGPRVGKRYEGLVKWCGVRDEEGDGLKLQYLAGDVNEVAHVCAVHRVGR